MFRPAGVDRQMVGWDEQELEFTVDSSSLSESNRITRTTMPLKLFANAQQPGASFQGQGKAHYIMTYLSPRDAPQHDAECRFVGVITFQGVVHLPEHEPIECSFVLEEEGMWSKEPVSTWKIIKNTLQGRLKDMIVNNSDVSGGSVHKGGPQDPSEGWLDLELK
ncbi:hypothetical protein OIO90_002338 [Microbotryomycetes sp. JL221]|nr:hypothetical protein OIO90_002338 [Microbotryomycetes sp. JL221]